MLTCGHMLGSRIRNNLLETLKKFLLPTLLLFGYTYAQWIILFNIPPYFHDTLGLSKSQIGIIISIFPLSSIILTVPFGIFSDKLSPKKLVSGGLLLIAISAIALKYSTGFWLLIFIFFIRGTGSSLFQISCYSTFYKYLGENHKGVKLGFFSGFTLLGYALGPLSGGYLLSKFPMGSLFEISFFITMLLFLLSFFLKDIEPVKFELVKYREDIMRKEVVVLLFLTFFQALHLGVEQTSFSLFLEKDIHLGKDSIGWMYFFIGVAISLANIVNGFISDSIIDRGKSLSILFYTGALISGAFNVFLLFPHTFGGVLLVRLLHIIGDSLFITSRYVIISNLFLSERIGGNLGLVTTFVTFGTFLGSLISGLIPGYLLPFIFTGSICILATIPSVIVKPRF